MKKISCGAMSFSQPVQGSWTITDGFRLSFPEQVLVDGTPFKRAKWREPKPGVIEQYREAVETNSRHLLVFGDGRWVIDHSDDVNPDMGDVTAPARHFVADHPVGQGLLALSLLAGVGLIVAGIAGALEG